MKQLEWCKAGPDGKGWFWGSHGCTDGAHEGHIHTCSVAEYDLDGEPLTIKPCCQADDQTGQARFYKQDGTWGEWLVFEGWWQ